MSNQHPWTERIERYRDRHRERHYLLRALVFTAGLLLLPLGVLLIPLPGPGWLIVAVAFLILSLELKWAASSSNWILQRFPFARTASPLDGQLEEARAARKDPASSDVRA